MQHCRKFRIKGEVQTPSILLVNGNIEGPIYLAQALLTAGPEGKYGNVVAREVVVFGALNGNIQADDRVEIKSSGSVMATLSRRESQSKTALATKDLSRSGKSSCQFRSPPP